MTSYSAKNADSPSTYPRIKVIAMRATEFLQIEDKEFHEEYTVEFFNERAKDAEAFARIDPEEEEPLLQISFLTENKLSVLDILARLENIIRENGKELGIEKRTLRVQEINDMRFLVATEAVD